MKNAREVFERTVKEDLQSTSQALAFLRHEKADGPRKWLMEISKQNSERPSQMKIPVCYDIPSSINNVLKECNSNWG
jgi:hypothetical protein